MATRVLVDANVLYSRTLRDWLFLLKLRSGGGMFTVHATEDVIAETLYRLRRNHPVADGSMITRISDRHADVAVALRSVKRAGMILP